MQHHGLNKMDNNFYNYWQNKLSFLDVHYHVNPDAYIRKFDAISAGTEYQKLGGGVVLKSHLGCCAAVAATAQLNNKPVFGSIVLNDISGGVSLRAVKQSLSHYSFENCPRLIVHLPTIVKSEHKSKLKRAYSNKSVENYAMNAYAIVDNNGKLTSEIEALFDFCQHEKVVISTGHASRHEVEALVNLAIKKGGLKLMLNQPASPITGMQAKDLKSLGNYDWLYPEQTALTLLLGYQSLEDFYEVLSSVNNL